MKIMNEAVEYRISLTIGTDAFVRERDAPVPVVSSGSRLSSAVRYEIVSRHLFLKGECGICSGRNIGTYIVNFERNPW